jgi:hypothetical protein
LSKQRLRGAVDWPAVTAGERPILDYMTPRPRPLARRVFAAVGRLYEQALEPFGWLPTWVTALVLTAPAWLLSEFGALNGQPALRGDRRLAVETLLLSIAFLVPGALQRRSGLQALVMAAVAAYWSAWVVWVKPPALPYPYHLLTYALPQVLLLALGEWAIARPRGRAAASLAWMLILAVAAACALQWIVVPLSLLADFRLLPQWHGSQRMIALGDFPRPPIFAVLAWVAIAQARRAAVATAASDRGGRFRGKLLVTASCAIATFPLFFHVLIYPIARASLRGGTPFVEGGALDVLLTRDAPHDTELMWQAVADPRWPRRAAYRNDGLRRRLVDVLAERDPRAPQRLAAVLSERPHRATAMQAAPLLTAWHRYEAVPVMLRYAAVGDAACADAVEIMRVPQAARARLALITAGRVSGEDRFRLRQMLGRDAGTSVDAWRALYDKVAPQLPTPLSPQQAAEADRILGAIEWFARETRKRGDGSVARQSVDWDAPDLEAEIRRVLDQSAAPPVR